MINADITLNGIDIYQSEGEGNLFTAERFDERVNFALKGSHLEDIFIENMSTTSDAWNIIIA